MIDILLAEDQSMVRQGLKMMIETDPEMRVLKEAQNGKETVAICESHAVDLVILDIRMPVMDGLAAAREIHRRWPDQKMLILTTFNDDDYALEALKCGASGYMLKDADAEELIRAIRSCLSGGLTLQDHVAAKVMPRLLNQVHEKQELDPNLTPREIAVIKLIGNGKNNQEIANELCLSVGTVKNHISVILDKLTLRDRTQIAIYAIRHHLV
ncbi:response regulator transcription factor [Salipaludibacillus sp. CUR1]|uniref:response regulator transcription factor n=1 Tax=Salipaludibacillus sp. CUR1 TaxID=2820003 RepID=UPI001E3B1C93|nr:response regulator transcription factor [Salipaludibacillus sp. CUR1]MCE7791723.1 response regulator transcription factor [Salipaludibacillus sp. CUR1]